MSAFAIEVKNASFRYGEKEIFENISFSVKAGEIFCILGPNGCGKTTLLDCILGILKLNSGEVLINQLSKNKLKQKQLAEIMAYVPQIHERTFPYTVEEIVLMGRAHKTDLFSSPTKKDKEIAMEAMKKVGIEQLSKKPYTQISGGQCQLVMIARALAQQPKLIIMDEPTSHLDFKHELILLETIVDLIKEKNISIIMATHFPNQAYYFENNHINTTLALMNNSSFEIIGSPEKVLNEENIRKTYNVNSKVIMYEVNNKQKIRQIMPLSIDRRDRCQY